mmetsp:Transcript_13814/g.37338  ORF Transcript_13814/g.37338 Transcript_13814/m.37338 type:complete len:341 (+) Transcript_13814:39-1061(+)
MARPSFKYVYLPADTQLPPEERTMTIPEGEEKEVSCLMDGLKEHFKSTGTLSDAAKEAHKQSILSQLGENASRVDLSQLDMVTGMQMVENVALLANSKDVGFVGVNMYCDDQAIAKELPLNPRACQIAECCGKMVQVRGDVFMARIFDNEDNFKRLDFTLGDLSSSAPWVAQAQQQVRKRYQQGPPAESKVFAGDRSRAQAQAQSAAGMSKPQIRELSPAEAAKEDGNAAFKRGDLPSALAAYTLALERDPAMVVAANNRALVNIRMKRFGDAESDCNMVLQHEPNNVKALLRRASAREGLGDPGAAAADFTRALQLEPGNKEAAAALDRLKPPPKPEQA